MIPFEEIALNIEGKYHGSFAGQFEVDERGRVEAILLDREQSWDEVRAKKPIEQVRYERERFSPPSSWREFFVEMMARELESECGVQIDEFLKDARANPARPMREVA